MSAEVAVIGLGRIGLPLAISFADRGLRVLGVDKDADRLQAVRDARMPFEEPEAQAALERVHAAGTLEVSDR
ncbi:MAG: UDP-N-acetyl-D-mannosaminuronic acid dehydrogenase, partial [Solirubrobacteraceae bacterium]|nr:UDP-N-acetyl-D-mannosaminuronic acid dehydrogenase [Solirubrobacteraceae bacterium]